MAKTILVDIDEATASLMDSINADITSDVRETVSTKLDAFKANVGQMLDETKQEVSSSLQASKQLSDKCLRSIEDVADQIDDIYKDIDAISALKEKFDVLKERFDIIDAKIEKVNELSVKIDNIGETIRSESERNAKLIAELNDRILSALNSISEAETDRHIESKSLLNRILQTATPFWKRKTVKNDINR